MTKRNRIYRDILILALVFLCGWLFFTYYPPISSDSVIEKYEKQEKNLGELLKNSFQLINVNKDTNFIAKSINKIFQELNPEITETYDIYIAEDHTINAFALPGNIIVINKGLIEITDNPKELIAVVAHEIGHIEENHVRKKLLATFGISVLFAGSDAPLSAITQILTESAFSREMEREADDYAVEYLLDNDLSPKYMKDIFLKMKENSIEIPEFISTHPELDSRIEDLSNKYDIENEIEFDVDWEKVKAEL